MRTNVCLIAVLVSIFAVFGFAQTDTPARRVVVRAGRVLDVKSGKTLSNQAIVIEGDKIVSVGRRVVGPDNWCNRH